MSPLVGKCAVRACVLRALITASRENARNIIIDEVAPAVLHLSWVGFEQPGVLTEAALCVTRWASIGLEGMAAQVLPCLLNRGVGDLPVAPNAYQIADWVRRAGESDNLTGLSHARVSAECGLPPDPSGFGPQSVLDLCKRRRLARGQLGEYFNSAACRILLYSKRGSLGPMASALVAWGNFRDPFEEPHFPIERERVAQFAASFRDEGSLAQYLSHLSAAKKMGNTTDHDLDQENEKTEKLVQK